ncbi:restriction endonuclease subunit S [Bordetella avium]|uniref:Restriction modification system, specificity subunit n=1 Tax=Bordetella avium (strain 197N) TaxID=360910 RepID=Q2KZC1_BORA1|nr:restriction endonuclease subunit S [Bordetella avium]CAJ47988.1 restriction modification system, specificity subunit [Bordetella avium 197N]
MADQIAGKVPRIRFKAYSEPWAEEKIGDVLAEKRRPIVLEDDQRYELITVKRRNEGVVSRGHLLGRDILVKNYAQLKAGDFVISKRQVVHGATGIVPPALDGAIVSNEYLVAVDSERLRTEFLTIVASLPAMRRKFVLSSYGVDIEKLFFDAADWKKRDIPIPCTKEQTDISGYFQALKHIIEFHQQKHGKIQALKQALLQKMFPRSGAATPELRFKGFSGNWAIERLGQVGRTQSGIGFPDTEQGGKVGTPFFKISDMSLAGNENEMLTANNYVNDAQLQRNRWVPIGDVPAVVFAKVGAALMLNRKRMVRSPFLIDNNAMAYIFDSTWDEDFGKALFDTIYLPKYAQVGALPSYNGSDIEGITVHRPKDRLEQKQIGGFFKLLDTLISKHATQLHKLKQVESACREVMFV